ncbi:MAG: nuclear transport factor 2 family protein [Croceibacterium sp.]
MPAGSQSIVDLETAFWQTMVDKDATKAAGMIADEGLVTGTMGTMRIDPAKYEKMTREGQWSLNTFEFSEVEVVCPSDDVAVIAYKVHQTGQMKGQPMDMQCADSSTWVRSDGEWKCVLHTETVLAKPEAGN